MDEIENNSHPQPARNRKKRRWLRRLFWGSAALAGVAFLIGALMLFLLYRNLVQIVNFGLREFVHPYSVSVEDIDFSERGVLRLEGVEIAAAPDLPRMASIPEIRVRYDWNRLRARHLGSVVIRDPVIRLTDAHLQPSARSVGGIVGGRRVGGSRERKRALHGYVIDTIRVSGCDVHVALGELPVVDFAIEASSGRLEFGREGELSPDPVTVRIRNFEARPSGAQSAGKALVSAEGIGLLIRPRADLGGGSIEVAGLTNAAVEVTPSLWPLSQRSASPAPSDAEEGVPPGLSPEAEIGSAPREWTLNSADLAGIKVSVRGFGNGGGQPVLPDVALNLSVNLKNMRFNVETGTLRSSDIQNIHLTDVSIRGGADEEDAVAARVARVDVEVVPDDLRRSGLIRKLHVQDPHLEITSETILRFLPPEVAEELAVEETVAEAMQESLETEKNLEEKEVAKTGELKIFVVEDLKLDGGRIAFDPHGIQEGLPIASGSLDIATVSATEAGAAGNAPGVPDAAYRAVLSDLDFKDPRIVRQEVATGQRIEIDFSARGVQAEQRIDRIDLVGFSLTVGDSLRGLVEAQGRARSRGKMSGGGAGKGWGIGEFSIRESRVFIQDLMPGLPMVSFEFHTPEALTGLAFAKDAQMAQDLVQRVEISGLEIKSPYDALTVVASLPDIFIEFTLAELTGQRRIRRVQVLNPQLWVGEHLFWYIDNLRRIEGEEKVGEALEAAKTAAADGAAASAEADKPADTESEPPRWSIGTIDIDSGKLIIAPKGYPIGFTPFPFSGSTDLEAGTIDLRLEIPEGDYSYPEMELEFLDLRGVVEFNLPNKDQDNNLYQRLEVGQLRFKKWEIDDAFLEITFDEAGVYSRYGGEAYKTEGFQGWVNGEANFYLGETYRWDGWVAATEVDLEPITRLIAPETVRMKGVLNTKLLAEGRQLNVNKASGDFEMLTPGQLKIPSLEKLLERLPDDWTQLERSLVDIGIEAFKDFDFDRGSGTLNYAGDEGGLDMELSGPAGSWSADLRFHDLSGQGLNFDILSASNL